MKRCPAFLYVQMQEIEHIFQHYAQMVCHVGLEVGKVAIPRSKRLLSTSLPKPHRTIFPYVHFSRPATLNEWTLFIRIVVLWYDYILRSTPTPPLRWAHRWHLGHKKGNSSVTIADTETKASHWYPAKLVRLSSGHSHCSITYYLHLEKV